MKMNINKKRMILKDLQDMLMSTNYKTDLEP